MSMQLLDAGGPGRGQEHVPLQEPRGLVVSTQLTLNVQIRQRCRQKDKDIIHTLVPYVYVDITRLLVDVYYLISLFKVKMTGK